ncbi:MAG: hypothetical protein AB1758_14075, partial [Candidatus Eremiobacterota bacterium]
MSDSNQWDPYRSRLRRDFNQLLREQDGAPQPESDQAAQPAPPQEEEPEPEPSSERPGMQRKNLPRRGATSGPTARFVEIVPLERKQPSPMPKAVVLAVIVALAVVAAFWLPRP